jgi:TRAP-type uncharacterized transport system fused permease subunit
MMILVNRGGILLVKEIFGFKVPVELLLEAIGILILIRGNKKSNWTTFSNYCNLFSFIFLFWKICSRYYFSWRSFLKRLVGFQWFDQEAIFGIPIGVSVDFIFLFVLFGALLETAGGGKYFLDLAFAMVGKMRGGPAKAAILGSGMTGMISGSSIANTVTTGTFTIPIMKKTGFLKRESWSYRSFIIC